MKRVQILLAFFLWSGLSVNAQPATKTIQNIIQRGVAPKALWSVSVRDTTGSELISLSSDYLITPASNLKLITTSALLYYLGEDFKFSTTVWGQGSLVDSTWLGDIYIHGSGDPSIGGDINNDDKWFAFDSIINQLKTFGINHITGSFIGDESFFDDEPYPHGWQWDDLSFYYATEIGALSFNRNTVGLVVHANGKPGQTPAIEWFPFNTDYVSFLNEQQITPRKTEYVEYYRRVAGTNTIILRSTLPVGYVEEEDLSITQPSLYFVDTFVKYARQQGLSFDMEPQISRVNLNYRQNFVQLAVYESKPLKNIIQQINKKSDNFYAEMMLKSLAAYQLETQGTTEAGLKLVRDFLISAKVDTSNVLITDGSGMSSSTLIRTRDMSQILFSNRSQPWFQTYLNSLSLAGKDGTLKNRFTKSPLNENFKGKTGYLSGARTLAGYFKTKSNKKLIVVLATNHFKDKVSKIDATQQQILEWLYENY